MALEKVLMNNEAVILRMKYTSSESLRVSRKIVYPREVSLSVRIGGYYKVEGRKRVPFADARNCRRRPKRELGIICVCEPTYTGSALTSIKGKQEV